MTKTKGAKKKTRCVMFLERLMMYVIFWKSPSFFLGPTHSSSRFSKTLPKIRTTLSVKWQRGSLSNIIKVHFTPLHTKRWVLYLDRDTFIVLNSAFYKQVQTCLKNILLIYESKFKPAVAALRLWRQLCGSGTSQVESNQIFLGDGTSSKIVQMHFDKKFHNAAIMIHQRSF